MELADTWDHTCSSVGMACRTGNVNLLHKLLENKRPVDVQDNRGWRPLHEAAAGNYVECLKQLLTYECTDKNWRTFEGETALFLASLRGHSKIVKFLLKNRSDPNIPNNEGLTPIIAAARSKNLECVKIFVKYRVSTNSQDWTGWSPLHEAVKQESINIVKFLIASKAVINICDDYEISPIFTAAECGNLEILKLLVENLEDQADFIDRGALDGATPLLITSQNGHLSCLEYLLEKEANPRVKTRDGVMAIHLATQFGHTKCVKKLLECLSAKDLEPVYNDKTRTLEFVSIIHIAVEWERVDILRLLLSKGLNVNIEAPWPTYTKDHDELPFSLSELFTPLSLAARSACIDIMKILLDAGAKPNPPSLASRAPLSSAVLSNSKEGVHLLIINGANVNHPHRDFCASEAAFLALHKNHSSILNLLLKLGADLNHCISAHKDSQEYLMFWSVMTEGHIKYTKNTEILSILLCYINYRNWYKIILKLSEIFGRKDPALMQILWKFLETPHSLQHLCRLKIRDMLLAKHGNFISLVNQLNLPECLHDLLLYSYKGEESSDILNKNHVGENEHYKMSH